MTSTQDNTKPKGGSADAQVHLDALREIVDIMAKSRADEGPVFEAILEKAQELCDAPVSGLVLVKPGDAFQTLAASRGSSIREGAARLFAEGKMPLDATQTYAAKCILERKLIHLPDMAEGELYKAGAGPVRAMVDDVGIRSVLFVPLILDGQGIGAITLFRPLVSAFDDRQIALVESFAEQAVIAIENVRQFREVQTRLEREAAAREILDVISQNQDDVQPVFEAVLRRAATLSGAPMSSINIVDEDRKQARLVAHWGEELRMLEVGQTVWSLEFDDADDRYTELSMRDGIVTHCHDLKDTARYRDGEAMRREIVQAEGLRTFLAVPLMRQGQAIGNIALYRREVQPFTDDEIALVESFAAQAVIAIENVRQFREVQTRLERERGMAEVLQLISTSRDDEGPVFDLILKQAAALCQADAAALAMGREGDSHQSLVAAFEVDPDTQKVYDEGQVSMNPDISNAALAIITGKPVHIPDMADTDGYRSGISHFVSVVDDTGIRTNLFVPLMTSEGGIGALILFRKEVRPYTDDEIALVETFAAQAVIAIENVGQFRKVQTQLERERATSEILKVISESRDDETPVFDLMLRKAAELCNADAAALALGTKGDTYQTMPASYGIAPATQEMYDSGQVPMDPVTSVGAKAILSGKPVHVRDMSDTEQYRSGVSIFQSVVQDTGIRTNLLVPLLTPAGGIGVLILFRKEVRPYTDDEIALVETFAAQAVIAIGNVRQFREVQERLEREEASREVLGVISRSRDDERPVFDAILKNASRLCKAPLAFLPMANTERTHVTVPAFLGVKPDFATALDQFKEPLGDSGLVAVRAIAEARVIQSADLVNDPEFPASGRWRYELVETEGARSVLLVPMMQGDIAIGAIMLYRREIAPFSDDDVQLVKTFAEQAVIAIENVRQFREVQSRFERERISAEILKLISQSRDDDRPVFDAILDKAKHVCQADQASMVLVNEPRTHIRLIADKGHHRSAFEPGTEWPIDQPLSVTETLRTGKVSHFADYKETELYKSGDPIAVRIVDIEGIRTRLSIPLLQDGRAIGVIGLSRRTVQPFSDDDIQMVETFAAQAVIAIENVRQFKALEELNSELGDRVEEQVGEIERMGRLKRFLPAAVADTVVSQGSDNLLKSHRALLGVLFCDIRGFTAFCETAEPEETIEVLQSYHEEMGALIAEHGAGVDTRAGDGIMVLFNDPLPCDDPAGDALRLGLAMRERMNDLSKKWRRHGHRLGFGVGISLGYATVGMVGSAGRFDYTASGTAVNLAARLCDQAKDGEILLSPRAYTAVEEDFEAEPVGELTLKGIHAPVEVFRVQTEG